MGQLADLPLQFLRGALIGFILAMPFGAGGVIAVRRTLKGGFTPGAATGLGAAAADSVYCLLALLGISSVSEFLHRHAFTINLIGGVVLLVLGLVMAFTAHTKKENKPENANLFACFITGALLAFTNPLTMVAFGAAFAGITVTSGTGQSMVTVWSLTGGAFTGAALNWLGVAAAAWFFRERVLGALDTLLRASGIIIAIIGIVDLILLFHAQ